jgi:hypothetical protein
MTESKIALTERLRREGRWPEASKFKDEVKTKLRAEGMKRAEAGEQAWQEMAEKFPPLPVAEPVSKAAARREPADDDESDVEEEELDDDCGVQRQVGDAAMSYVGYWENEFGVTLSDDARYALVGIIICPFWVAGRDGEIPHVPEWARPDSVRY